MKRIGKTKVKLQFATDVAAASFVDILENILGDGKGDAKINDRILEFNLSAYCIKNILVELGNKKINIK